MPSSDPGCLTEPPPPIAGVVVDIPATGDVPRFMVDELVAAYNETRKYAGRAWRLCGSVKP